MTGSWRLRPNAPSPGTVLGPEDAVPDGGAREYRFGRGRSAFAMFVIRQGAMVRGYLNLCPHFSLPLNHAPDAFIQDTLILCRQHFARFLPENGLCIEGACVGSRLDPIPLRIEHGVVLIGDQADCPSGGTV